MSQERSVRVWGLFSLFLLGGMVFLSWWLAQPPTAIPADAPAEQFSAERAMSYMKVMGAETHPAGSAADDAVFEYIQAQVKALGLEMEVIDAPQIQGGNHVEYRRAVLGRLRGTASTKAFAVDAHFDSTPYGPGAADDISGISAMLETARALKAGPPLKNDVIFVFADQEEATAGGARAFAEHAWFKDVAVMLGLEVRGVRGAALMFETSEENGWIMQELARSEVSARANSIMFSVYRRLPFASDFNHYKRLVPGYNVAYIDGFGYYHTKMDRPDKVSLASIQHHGSYTLGLARHLGNLPLNECRAPNATYFNLLGSWLVVYPQTWDGPLSVVAMGLAGLALVVALIRRAVRLGGLAGAFGVLFLTLALSALVCAPSIVGLILYRESSLYQNTLYCTGFVTLGLAVNLAVYGWARQRIHAEEMIAASLCVFIAALSPLFKYLAGGAHLAIWPMIFGAVALLVLAIAYRKDAPAKGWMAGALAIWMLPVASMVTPLLVMLAYTLTPLGTFMLNMVVSVVLGLMAAQWMLIAGWGRWRLSMATAALGVALLVWGGIANRPSPDTPKLNCLSYAANFDTNEFWWLSADRTTPEWFRDISGISLPKSWFAGQKPTDSWTEQFFPDSTPRTRVPEFLNGDMREYLVAPAPAAPFGKFAMDIVKDEAVNGRRVLTLHIDSPRDAQRVSIEKRSEGPVYATRYGETPLQMPEGAWRLGVTFMPKPGVDLTLEVDPGTPLKFFVREESWSCVEFPQYRPRPDDMAMEPNRTIDHGRGLRSGQTLSLCTVDVP